MKINAKFKGIGRMIVLMNTMRFLIRHLCFNALLSFGHEIRLDNI